MSESLSYQARTAYTHIYIPLPKVHIAHLPLPFFFFPHYIPPGATYSKEPCNFLEITSVVFSSVSLACLLRNHTVC